MNKKFFITEEDKREILNQYREYLTEQKVDTNKPDFIELNKLLTQGCLKGTTEQIVPFKDRLVFSGNNTSQGPFYVYADRTVLFLKTGKTIKLKCSVTPIDQTKLLDQNQQQVLSSIKDEDWATEPVPSEFQLDQGLYVMLDLTDDKTIIPTEIGDIKTSKYFPRDKFPSGFKVYKRQLKSNVNPTDKLTQYNVTPEMCQSSIDNLYKIMENPDAFNYKDEDKDALVNTVKICSNQINKGKLGILKGSRRKLKELIKNKFLES